MPSEPDGPDAPPGVPGSLERDVLRVTDIGFAALEALFAPSGLAVVRVAEGTPIPGSHWGDDEAGLIACKLYLRADTPVHSALHEGCHWLLMDEARRERLHTDAGGSSAEENAVCCLQILLAAHVPGVGRARMLADMDRWGYSFRLGSAARWFDEDAGDARATLRTHVARLAPLLDDIDPDERLPEVRRPDERRSEGRRHEVTD